MNHTWYEFSLPVIGHTKNDKQGRVKNSREEEELEVQVRHERTNETFEPDEQTTKDERSE